MELLGDVGLVESHFFPFRDSVSVSAKRFTVGPRRTIGSTRSSFWPFGHGANLDAR